MSSLHSSLHSSFPPNFTPSSSIISSIPSFSASTETSTSSHNNNDDVETISTNGEEYDEEGYDDEDEETERDSDAEAEWVESMRQLELLLTMVLVPFAGKWLGRRCAIWIWSRFMEWKHPVDVVVTSKAALNIGGVVSVAAASAPL